MKLKKGDQVVVTIGKDKGRKGKVEKLWPEKDVILLPGLNVYKRHLKKRDEKNQGGIVDISRPIAVSKVAFFCPSCKKASRLGYKMTKTKKIRICKKCQKEV